MINICTWNISKGLVRKLSDSGFLNIVKEYDVLCFNECWVKCPDDFDTKRILRSLSFDNNGLVKPSCGTIALYGPFGFF